MSAVVAFLILVVGSIMVIGLPSLLILVIFDLLRGRRPFALTSSKTLSKLSVVCWRARQLIVQNKRLIGASLFLSVLITAVSCFSAGGSLGSVGYKSQTGRGFPFAYLVTTPLTPGGSVYAPGGSYYSAPTGPTTALLWPHLLLDLVIWFILSIILLMGTKRLLLSYLIEK